MLKLVRGRDLLLVLSAGALWMLLAEGALPRCGPASEAATDSGCPPALGSDEYEAWARAWFYRKRPGHQPLNWRLAEVALRFHRERPMGDYVLSVTPGKWGNDCSDFVEAIIDEALGAGARFLRPDSQEHLIGLSPVYFEHFTWDRRSPLLPGDAVRVRHSPWYPPRAESYSHLGLIGADGLVYDFVQLRTWPQPRYGRTSVEWFTRHCGADQVTVARLRPQYRYWVQEVAVGPVAPAHPVSPD